ncbi:SDR family NAD(P)-dependent oxidoreductase [Streptomyces xantholiticus]
MTASRATVFVTGPGSGFGVAIARRFTAAGARVVISGRRGDKLAAVAADR